MSANEMADASANNPSPTETSGTRQQWLIDASMLSGAALDWAVAHCEGLPIRKDPMGFGGGVEEGGYWIWDDGVPSKARYELIGRNYSPSTKWEQVGPLIDRHGISIWKTGGSWHARDFEAPNLVLEGSTPLVAAMRFFVASRLGTHVDVPVWFRLR